MSKNHQFNNQIYIQKICIYRIDQILDIYIKQIYIEYIDIYIEFCKIEVNNFVNFKFYFYKNYFMKNKKKMKKRISFSISISNNIHPNIHLLLLILKKLLIIVHNIPNEFFP